MFIHSRSSCASKKSAKTTLGTNLPKFVIFNESDQKL